jgi:hypothetical protein
MELQLKHITGYLPYNLEAIDEYGVKRIVSWSFQSYTQKVVGLNHLIGLERSDKFTPLLISLDKLTDEQLYPIGLIFRDIFLSEATIKDKIFGSEDATAWIRGGMRPVLSLEQTKELMEYLYSIHADVNGLIKLKLAIDK